MEIKYTQVFIINDKLVVADKIEKAIEVYKCKYPYNKIESLTLLSSKSDSYDKDFDALIEDATINQKDFAPSESQIEALESATENCAYSEYQDCLRELIGQLKSLREE